MTRILRLVLIGAAVLLVLAAGGIAAVLLNFDPDQYKPDIEAAVTRATGRTLTLNGKIAVKLSLAPTLHVADAAFANPPGFSRPQMATLGALDLQIALLPLISGDIHIERLIMIKPDILLETNTAGQPNWRFNPPGAAGTAPPRTAEGAPAGGVTQPETASVSVSTLSIQDGQVGFRDDRTGKVVTVGVKSFEASAASPEAPVSLKMDGSYGGKDFTLTADTGALARLQQAGDTPWPVKLTLAALGAKLAANGTLGLRTGAYDVTLSGTVPDLAAFAVLAPDAGLPPLHDIRVDTRLSGAPGGIPEVSALTAHAGASDLGSLAPGFAMTALDIKAPSTNEPMQVSASFTRGGTPLTLTGTLGAPAALQPNAKPAPFPLDLTLAAAGATIAVKGEIANVTTQTALNLGLSAHIPDLAALSPLARQDLPPLKQVAFTATLTDAPGGLRNGVHIRDMTLSSPDADMSGDLGLALLPRPMLTAKLTSRRIDLDALETASEATSGAAPTPQRTPQGTPQGGASAGAAAERTPRETRIFPDTPIPFDVLRKGNADIALTVATLHASGADIRSLTIHLGLKDGRLAVDHLDADLPAGRMSGSVTVDATQPAPPVHVQLHAPGLSLKTVLAMTGQPPVATGNLELHADLTGSGASPHAIASSLDGTLGLAVAGGTLDNRIMGSFLGRVLAAINLIDLAGKGGTSELRCFATLVRASHGTATIDPLALSSSLLTMSGSGTANLGPETLNLTLKPQVRAAATTLVIPVDVSGPMRAPAVAVNKLGAAEANIGTVAGAAIGSTTPLGIIGGLLGAGKAIGLTAGDPCPAALAAARGQPAPPQAGTQQPPPAASPSLSNPAAALKSLFR